MSLGNGNPKEGDKGSNFNFELKVLQGLQTVINNGATCCNDLTTVLNNINNRIQPQRRYANVLSTTTTGDVPPCYSFSIANVGTATGRVAGQNLPAGATVNFDAGVLGNYFDENGILSYDATGTTFLITYIQD